LVADPPDNARKLQPPTNRAECPWIAAGRQAYAAAEVIGRYGRLPVQEQEQHFPPGGCD
jgi:hypothetical protein